MFCLNKYKEVYDYKMPSITVCPTKFKQDNTPQYNAY